MDTGGISATNIGTNVWLTSPRTLTGFGAGALVLASSANTTLAASASLDIRPSVGKFRVISFGIAAGAAGAGLIQMWDGTSTRTVFSIAQATSGGGLLTGTSVAGPKLGNADATNAMNYLYGGVDFTQ